MKTLSILSILTTGIVLAQEPGNPNPTLQATPASLTFTYQLNSFTEPPAQQITLTSSGSQLSDVTALAMTNNCGAFWIDMRPSAAQVTPATLSVKVAYFEFPADFPIEVCTATIDIFAPGARNTALRVPVTLNLTKAPSLNARPNQLNFTYQTGGAAPNGALVLSSSGAALDYTASGTVVTPVGSNWLTLGAATGATPNALTVGTLPAGLAAGTYTGMVTIGSAGASNPSQTVPVSLTVTDTPTLLATPTQVNFAYQTGRSQPAAQPVSISSSSGASIPYAVTSSTKTSAGWLNVTTGQNGVTPSSFTVSVTTAGLAPGRYDGSLDVSATGSSNPALLVPVKLFVSNSALLVTSPPSLTYNIPAGSTSTDASGLISVSSTDGAKILYVAGASASDGVGWLSWRFEPNDGPASVHTTPNDVRLSVNPTRLAVGSYNGHFDVMALTPGVSNSSQTIPLIVNITPTATLEPSPTALNFSQIAGEVAPASQTLFVVSSAGPSNFTATATSDVGSWLSVSPNSSTTGDTLTVSVNAAGLPAGAYNGSIIAFSGTAESITVPVTLTVQAAD